MKILRRHKYILIALLVYWPALFTATHIRTLPHFVGQLGMTDDMMHYLAYLVLVCLVWLAVSPYDKVNWQRPKVWIVLAVIVWYGAIDEWLQGFVGRETEVTDLISDLCGALTSLIILSIFDFWLAVMIISGIVIFVMTNLSRVNLICGNELINSAFYFLAYIFFTLVWIQYADRFTSLGKDRQRWYVGALGLPLGVLAVMKGVSVLPLFGKNVWYMDCVTAACGIAAAVIVSDVVLHYKRRDRIA